MEVILFEQGAEEVVVDMNEQYQSESIQTILYSISIHLFLKKELPFDMWTI